MVATEVGLAIIIRTKTASPETTLAGGEMSVRTPTGSFSQLSALASHREAEIDIEMELFVNHRAEVTVGSMGSGFCDELEE